MIWQPIRAIAPAILMIIMATGSIQSKQSSIQSLHQFTTDNIMLLSWITLMIWSSWLMYLWWYELVVSVMWVSIITVIIYCVALAFNYEDGIIVRHQASIISIAGTLMMIIIFMIQNRSLWQFYWGISAIYLTIIGAILVSYRVISYVFDLLLPWYLCSEIIVLWAILIPTTTIFTILFHNIMRACTATLLLYWLYGRWLWQLSHYHYPITNYEEITLDLILKWYKTNHVSHINRRSRVTKIFTHINQIEPIIRSIIQYIPDVIMIIAYVYLVINLMQRGIMVTEFIAYCVSFGVYISLRYIYQSNPSFHIDTTAQSFVFGYLSILALMITVFASDPVTGSIIGILWVIINALIVTQYDRLQLWLYIQAHHAQRRVQANTVWAVIIIWVMIQLPIDSIMIIPVILIVMAILWFTIAQSYVTLRTLK